MDVSHPGWFRKGTSLFICEGNLTNTWLLDKQVPTGFSDLFLDQAAAQWWLSDTLRALFAQWGYAPIIPPTVVYAENLAVELGAQMAQDMYRFFDREGHILALRADLTVPVARIVGTRLYDQPLPLRLCYVERVFRHIAPQAGQRREFTQAGVELIGADTPQADAEVVALAAHALQSIGVRDFRLTLGQMGFFRALVNALYLSVDEVQQLKQAIDRRNDAALCAVLEQMSLPQPVYALLRALPTLCGGREVVDQARRMTPLAEIRPELDRLEAVCDILTAYDLDRAVVIDLGEVRGMEYYTGLVFQGYAAGLGMSLCSGGRYNNLIGHLGPSLPAIGLGIDLGLAHLAVEPPVHIRPHLIVQGCMHSHCLAVIQRMRQNGRRVVVDVLNRSLEELTALAHAQNACVVRCLDGLRWQVTAPDGQEITLDEASLLKFCEERTP